ncbi:MAG: class I SAM-dependent methyltransferase [Saprospiraceae bacterium]|nr:class I SAM-dependent methyltransferase [Saprospiraceae bacterium]
MNYFAPITVAERYANGRPNFHSNTISHVKGFLKLEHKFNSALDIACGTGLSTQALLEIASHVYGTDSSKAMLDFALQKDKINYQIAKAEEQAFENNFFDLITVCSGVHWFDIDKFLMETSRLLKNRAWLILYDNFFLAEMEGVPKFKEWYKTNYLKTFPAPARIVSYNWTNENLDKVKFNFFKEEKFSNAVSFTKNELVLYFTTQSNIISKVENNETNYRDTEIWLNGELNAFFMNENDTKTFLFGNWIKYLQKIS